MKLFGILFSFLVLLLSFMPCKDMPLNGIPGDSTVILNKSCDTPSTGDDSCTPFCLCSCCTITTLPQVVSYSMLPPFSRKFVFTEHLSGKFIEISLPVWQPPQQI